MNDIIKVNDKLNDPHRKLKQEFAFLNKDDILSAEGKQEELLTRLQDKLGKTKEEICRIIYDL